jgi:hypothetical protein
MRLEASEPHGLADEDNGSEQLPQLMPENLPHESR